MTDPLAPPEPQDLKAELRKLVMSISDKREEDLTPEERETLEEGIGNLAALGKGLTDLAMPGIDLIASDIADAKRKANDLQTFCEKLEKFQVDYAKANAMALLEIIEVLEGTRQISPTWKSNLRKKAGIE